MGVSIDHHSGDYYFLASASSEMDKRQKSQQMIRSLRKRHLQIWSALAVLIPVSIVSAVIARPKPITTILLQPEEVAPLPVVIKTVERENYVVRLRGSNETPTQLEWINRNILTFPTAVIYKTQATFSPRHSDLIGRIEARGTYRFALKPDQGSEYHFVLYDFIHQQKIDSINF